MQLGLLGFAAKIEVRFQAEPLLRLDDFQNLCGYPFCRFVKAICSTGVVGKQDAKEDCCGTSGVDRQRVPDPYDVGSQRIASLLDSCCELALVDNSARHYRHRKISSLHR